MGHWDVRCVLANMLSDTRAVAGRLLNELRERYMPVPHSCLGLPFVLISLNRYNAECVGVGLGVKTVLLPRKVRTLWRPEAQIGNKARVLMNSLSTASRHQSTHRIRHGDAQSGKDFRFYSVTFEQHKFRNKTKSSNFVHDLVLSSGSRSIMHTKQPCDFDLTTWPFNMTLKLIRIVEIAKMHVRARLYQAKCSGSWVAV